MQNFFITLRATIFFYVT